MDETSDPHTYKEAMARPGTPRTLSEVRFLLNSFGPVGSRGKELDKTTVMGLNPAMKRGAVRIANLASRWEIQAMLSKITRKLNWRGEGHAMSRTNKE